MADYISRQAAINIVCDDECDDCPDGGCDMYRRLKRLPAADVRPVVRGRWKHSPDTGTTACTACGWSIEENFYDPTSNKDYAYCPNCGADMRGGVEDG